MWKGQNVNMGWRDCCKSVRTWSSDGMIKSRHESIHLAFQYIYYEYEMGNGEWRDHRGSWIHYQLQKAAFLKQGRRKGPTPQVFIYTTHSIQHTMHGIVNSCSPAPHVFCGLVSMPCTVRSLDFTFHLGLMNV